MCPNLLAAIKSIADFRNNDLKDYFATYPIRINAVGQQLEFYIKDAICGSFNSTRIKEDFAKDEKVFSYLVTKTILQTLLSAMEMLMRLRKFNP
jgi:hypothetical protein